MPEKKLKFLKHKPLVDAYLVDLLQQKRKLYSEHSQVGITFDYLEHFVKSGKTVRGSLFLESILELDTSSETIEKYLPIAAGIELVHSALLIQDDFMDQDASRRGMQSLHTDLLELAQRKNYRSPNVYSPSAIMCITDIIFFIAFEQLVRVSNSSAGKLLEYISQEYSHVGFSQWKDVSLSNRKELIADKNDIEVVYKYKTARYTFVAPVRIAGIVAEADDTLLDKLDRIMEDIGMIFQIRDDYLSLFGDEEITGKPVGGDIIENKKTLYKYYLFENLETISSNEREQVEQLYGKKQLTKTEILLIQDLHRDLGVLEIVEKQINEYEEEIKNALKELEVSDNYKSRIQELLEFVSQRKK